MGKNVAVLYQIHKLELMHKRGWKSTHGVLWQSMVYNLYFLLFFLLFLVIILFHLSFVQFNTIYLPLPGRPFFFVLFSRFISYIFFRLLYHRNLLYFLGHVLEVICLSERYRTKCDGLPAISFIGFPCQKFSNLIKFSLIASIDKIASGAYLRSPLAAMLEEALTSLRYKLFRDAC